MISTGHARAFGRRALVALVLAGLVGCASAVNGTKEDLVLDSTPPGARVTLSPGGIVATTPATVTIRRGVEYELRFELEGYEPRVERVYPQIGKAWAGNLLLGGVVGMNEDQRSGAAYVAFPNPVHVELVRDGDDASAAVERSTVMFFNTTSDALYSDGSPITIHVGDRLLGTIKIGEYLNVDLEPGTHRLRLQHRDVWQFEDEDDLVVDGDVIYLKVFARPISTKFERVDSVPEGF